MSIAVSRNLFSWCTTGYNQKSITKRKTTYVQRLYVLELELNVAEITIKILAVYPIHSNFVAETVRLKCTYLFISGYLYKRPKSRIALKLHFYVELY